MKKLNIILLVITGLAFSSCSHRVLDFTLISSKNVDFSKASTFEKGSERVKGTDMVHWIIIVPLGTASIKEAIDKAIESTPGCVALLDGVIYTKFWWIPYIYGQQSAVIEGTPLIDPSFVYNSEDAPTYGKIEMNKNGEIESVEKLSNSDYFSLKDKIVKDAKETKFDKTEVVAQISLK